MILTSLRTRPKKLGGMCAYILIFVTRSRCPHAAQIWSDYDEAAAKQAEVELEDDFGARKPEYIDVIVSDVRTKNGFSFSVQILNTEGELIGDRLSVVFV